MAGGQSVWSFEVNVPIHSNIELNMLNRYSRYPSGNKWEAKSTYMCPQQIWPHIEGLSMCLMVMVLKACRFFEIICIIPSEEFIGRL